MLVLALLCAAVIVILWSVASWGPVLGGGQYVLGSGCRKVAELTHLVWIWIVVCAYLPTILVSAGEITSRFATITVIA